jgi:hypothetical protein
MHKSKRGGFIIDCRTDDLAQAAEFWGGALGMPPREPPGSEGDFYRRLDDAQLGPHRGAEGSTRTGCISTSRATM